MVKFGILKSKIEKILLESYINGNFSNEMKKFKKLVLENKNISKIHFIYDELNSNKGISENIVDDYINSYIKIYENTINKIDPKEFVNLNAWVKDCKIEKNNYENIDTVLSNTILNLENKIQSKKMIAESLKKPATVKEPIVNLPLSTMINVANQTIQKFMSNLNESDKKEITKLLTSDDDLLKKEFDIMKESVIIKLTDMKSNVDENVKSSIDETINKLNSESYDKLSYYKLKVLKENI